MSALSVSAAHAVAATARNGACRGAKYSLRAPVRCTRTTTAAVSDASARSTSDDAAIVELLSGVQIRRATDGETVDAASLVPNKGRVLMPFLTQFADFDSWELAQKLVRGSRGVDSLKGGEGEAERMKRRRVIRTIS